MDAKPLSSHAEPRTATPAEVSDAARSPLDRLLAGLDRAHDPGTPLRQFLDAPDLPSALALWIDQWADDGFPATATDLLWRLERDVGRIDEYLGQQLDAVLHHPSFQRLESSWRGLDDLVGRVPAGANVKLRIFSATKSDLARDLERAIEFDQSSLFRKVYSDEFDMPGGEPYSVLLGDYEFGHHPGDVDALASISNVAAAAFAPFVAGAHPSLFGLEDFGELERPMDLDRHFQQLDFLRWRRLRETEDARFLALTLPRVLRREPYDHDADDGCNFPYREDVSAPGAEDYLWGTAVYAYAGVLVRAFQRYGWIEDIRGATRDQEGGGLVTGLPAPAFDCDPSRIAPRGSTDLNIDEELDRELRDLGFLPFCHCQGTTLSAFHGIETLQIPKVYDRQIATANAGLSAQLPVVFNVSRFAHYLKLIARDRIGSFLEPRDLELVLQRWLMRYVSANEEAGIDPVPRYPLREAQVLVRERPDKPGSYVCVLHLRPRLQDDSIAAKLRLITEITDQWSLQPAV
jgi:type VI secretion system ImpC/EvpB family protein